MNSVWYEMDTGLIGYEMVLVQDEVYEEYGMDWIQDELSMGWSGSRLK